MTIAPSPELIMPGFADLGVPDVLAETLASQGILEPFAIQTATLRDSLAGRDVLGRGRTGSGKTLAFSLPVVARLAAAGRRRNAMCPRALVLVPTRELALQVLETLNPLAKAMDLRTVAIVGGVRQGPQVDALRRGAEIAVATPGRLEDLIAQGYADLSKVEIVVLDEADHMCDLGFLPPVRRLLDATPRSGQRLLFSATIDKSVDVLVRKYLTDPVVHSVDDASSHVPAMEHHVFEVTHGDKPAIVRELVSGEGRTIAFTRTKHTAKKLAKQLAAAGVPAVDLHGNLTQAARRRNLEAFSSGQARVLVATDIAARGIHVDDVALVVHVDPPTEHKAYLHRSGRTARAGAEGVVVTVCLPDQRRDVTRLMKMASISPTRQTASPADAAIRDLVGPEAALVEFVAPAAPEQPKRSRSGPSRRRRAGGSGRPQDGSRASGQGRPRGRSRAQG